MAAGCILMTLRDSKMEIPTKCFLAGLLTLFVSAPPSLAERVKCVQTPFKPADIALSPTGWQKWKELGPVSFVLRRSFTGKVYGAGVFVFRTLSGKYMILMGEGTDSRGYSVFGPETAPMLLIIAFIR